MVNNSPNSNKKNYHLSPQIINLSCLHQVDKNKYVCLMCIVSVCSLH